MSALRDGRLFLFPCRLRYWRAAPAVCDSACLHVCPSEQEDFHWIPQVASGHVKTLLVILSSCEDATPPSSPCLLPSGHHCIQLAFIRLIGAVCNIANNKALQYSTTRCCCWSAWKGGFKGEVILARKSACGRCYTSVNPLESAAWGFSWSYYCPFSLSLKSKANRLHSKRATFSIWKWQCAFFAEYRR